jgi:hypothetical protein
MDYKIVSIALVIALLVVGTAFVFVIYGDEIGAIFSGKSSNADVGKVFSAPPEDINPPIIPSS